MTLRYFFINNYYFLCLLVGICYTKLRRKDQLILDFLLIFSRQILGFTLGLSKVPSIFKRIFLICISHEEQYLGDPLSIVFSLVCGYKKVKWYIIKGDLNIFNSNRSLLYNHVTIWPHLMYLKYAFFGLQHCYTVFSFVIHLNFQTLRKDSMSTG